MSLPHRRRTRYSVQRSNKMRVDPLKKSYGIIPIGTENGS